MGAVTNGDKWGQITICHRPVNGDKWGHNPLGVSPSVTGMRGRRSSPKRASMVPDVGDYYARVREAAKALSDPGQSRSHSILSEVRAHARGIFRSHRARARGGRCRDHFERSSCVCQGGAQCSCSSI
jgi:hypothetical protein